MTIFERYKKLINDAKASGNFTKEFIDQTKERITVFYEKGKLSKEEYEELMSMLK